MPYDLYPAVDENYDFPPEVREALSLSPELRNTVVPMTEVQRNNLVNNELWDGRLVFNTTTEQIDRYDATLPGWVAASMADHGGLVGLGDDDHPQYLLRTGQAGIAKLERVLQRVDTRSTTLGYTSGNLTTVTEKAGSTTVKATTLAYVNGKLTTVTEVVGGQTITTTLSYNFDETLGSVTRSVS